MLFIDQAFLANPELQRYFYSGADIDQTHADYPKVFAMANLMLDFMDSRLTLSKQMSDNIDDPEAWHAYFVHVFSTSPVLCKMIRQDKHIYGESIVEIGETGCRGAGRGRQLASA